MYLCFRKNKEKFRSLRLMTVVSLNSRKRYLKCNTDHITYHVQYWSFNFREAINISAGNPQHITQNVVPTENYEENDVKLSIKSRYDKVKGIMIVSTYSLLNLLYNLIMVFLVLKNVSLLIENVG